jgi:prefoldin subunit 5
MTLIPNDYQKEINEAFEISKKEIDALKAENKELNEQLRLHSVSNSLNLRELERKLDEALGKETRETLTEWLKQQRQ